MQRAGLEYAGPIHADGKLHRIKCGDDRGRNSWYVLFPGPPAGGKFGCWKRGCADTWHERNGELSQAEWNRVRQHWQDADAARERSESELRDKARSTAKWILKHSTPASPSNGYAKKKGVGVQGELRQRFGKLVLPLRDADGELHSLQFIGADGEKRFLTGGKVHGCFYTVADKPDGPLVVVEGFATGASVHAAAGCAVVCAMNAGNLLATAEALREKWPQREFIVAGDNDAHTDGNPGLTKATEAAKAIGAKLAVPTFKDTSVNASDFNDLAALDGLDEVKRQIESAAVPQETEGEVLQRLAALPPLEFDRAVKAEAARLGVKAGTLAREVAKCRPQTNRNAQGFAVDLPDVEPWPHPLDGAEALREVAAVFSHYVFLPDGGADALALWTAHTHCFEAFLHTPRLNLRSAEKGCGKTTLLDVLASLTPRAMRTENMTSAVLFRVIDRHKPVLLLDEVDAYLEENEELRGLLNAGHRRGARAYRVEGDNLEVRGFNAFSPAVLAGIGGLTGKLSTLHDRSVIIRLTRAKPGEVAARFDSRRTASENELCRKLARWTADNFDNLQNSDPALPAGAFNRLADNWRCLFAIAQAAAGDWPRRAAEAFVKLSDGEDLDAQGIGQTLLADVADIFAAAGTDRMESATLAKKLAAIEGRQWAEFGKPPKEISPNKLARLLRRFNITPATIRTGPGEDDTAKGYRVDDFADAFERFLPKPPVSNRHTVTEAVNIGGNELSEPSQPESVLRIQNAVSTNKDAVCDGVTVQKGPHPRLNAGLASEHQPGGPRRREGPAHFSSRRSVETRPRRSNAVVKP